MIKRKWTILIIIVMLWLLGGAILMVNISLTENENTTVELTKVAFVILGGLGVVLPTYINIMQSLENRNVLKEKIEYDRIENAYALIKEWEDGELVKARELTRQINKDKHKMSAKGLLKKVASDPLLEHSIVTIFNYWVRIRMSIHYKRANAEILREAVRPVFLNMYQVFEPWINSQNKNARVDLEKLYEMWK